MEKNILPPSWIEISIISFSCHPPIHPPSVKVVKFLIQLQNVAELLESVNCRFIWVQVLLSDKKTH